ncbi:MAG: helix-turn-helix domain-containing protein [Puniceicoccales bacterium]|jgi:transcriptional regulator with XRE-family HTH domain|nr:helix-turn-helix domain-containing protein [Puniceicoccales bacterium]
MSERRFRNLIGPQIRTLRKQRGLTQEEFAAQLQLIGASGLDRGKIAKIETQIRSVFDYEWLAFSKILHAPVEKFLPSDSDFYDGIPRLSVWESEERALAEGSEAALARAARKPKGTLATPPAAPPVTPDTAPPPQQPVSTPPPAPSVPPAPVANPTPSAPPAPAAPENGVA